MQAVKSNDPTAAGLVATALQIVCDWIRAHDRAESNPAGDYECFQHLQLEAQDLGARALLAGLRRDANPFPRTNALNMRQLRVGWMRGRRRARQDAAQSCLAFNVAAVLPAAATPAAGAAGAGPCEAGAQLPARQQHPWLAAPASRVIRHRTSGEVVFETYSTAQAEAINKAKYEAVPIYQHLLELNDPQSLQYRRSRGIPADRPT